MAKQVINHETPKVTVKYTAQDSTVFWAEAYYYEVQEALMELSRQAYEAGTSMHKIEIY